MNELHQNTTIFAICPQLNAVYDPVPICRPDISVYIFTMQLYTAIMNCGPQHHEYSSHYLEAISYRCVLVWLYACVPNEVYIALANSYEVLPSFHDNHTESSYKVETRLDHTISVLFIHHCLNVLAKVLAPKSISGTQVDDVITNYYWFTQLFTDDHSVFEVTHWKCSYIIIICLFLWQPCQILRCRWHSGMYDPNGTLKYHEANFKMHNVLHSSSHSSIAPGELHM